MFRRMLAIVLAISFAVESYGAVNVTASRDYVDRKVTSVSNSIIEVSSKIESIENNTYTKDQTDRKIVELAPAPGNYENVSNAAINALSRTDALETEVANKADKSFVNTLDANKADKSFVNTHVANTGNPHAVTASQVGAVPFVDDADGKKTAVTIGVRVVNRRVGEFSVANGKKVTAAGDYSHAEGNDTSAWGNYSHAEGYDTSASGDESHAEGHFTAALGVGSHAEGSETEASGICSHAEGQYTTASGDCSHAGGFCSNTKYDDFAFAWNGDTTRTRINPYESHGQGTFNINPVGGLAGFYVGDTNLETRLISMVSVYSSYIWDAQDKRLYRREMKSGHLYWTPVTNVNALLPENIAILNYLEEHKND